jgi:hypothetical protein
MVRETRNLLGVRIRSQLARRAYVPPITGRAPVRVGRRPARTDRTAGEWPSSCSEVAAKRLVPRILGNGDLATTDGRLRKSCMGDRGIEFELHRFEGQEVYDTGPFDDVVALVSRVSGPASEREVAECFAERILPDVLRELWAVTREATLFEDSAYRQSGLMLLAPRDAVAATAGCMRRDR